MIKVDENDPIGELEPTFPYRDVSIKRGVDMKEFYDLEGEIGRGKFGTVYKCREKGTNLTLAAKFVGIARRQDRKNVEREVEIMKTLQHPRLIQLYDAFETDNVMCVVLELIEGGELFERVIDDDFILTERACTVFMRQICEGVAFIHSHNIIHLDLKPENILCLTKTGNRIKIIDFGLARKYEPDKKLQVLFGTPEFVAPEVVNFDQISCATDMWSVGVICYVLLSGLSPFMGETDVETMANVTIARYDFDDDSFDDISPEAKDFIRKLLVKDKEARLTAVECLSHPWLRRQIPPPPPALDTTKDNLRTYVENSVPFIHNPIIIEKPYHDKPGLIEKIIENEQKIIHSIPISQKNELPLIPPLIDNQIDKILKTDKSRFKMLNNVDNLSKTLENQKLQTPEIVEEYNMKNNSLIIKDQSNNLHPPNQNIIESFGINKDLNNSNPNNIIKITPNGPVQDTESRDKLLNARGMGTLCNINALNDSQDKKNANLIFNAPTKNALSEKNVAKLQEKPIENRISENKINKSITEHTLSEKSITVHPPVSSELFHGTQKAEKIFSEKCSVMSGKDTMKETFNSSVHKLKRGEDTNVSIAQNKLTIPLITVPAVSTPHVSNPSSDFSLINLKAAEPFTTKTERNFVSICTKTTENKKTCNDRLPPPGPCIENSYKEGAPKENDPLVYKQHLRSTPPWFSELKNQDSRYLTADRFDRRSSDFSCFLNSKEDSESLSLADEIRKLSARLLQMSNNQSLPQNQNIGCHNANNVPSHSRNDPITCFLENHGIHHPRPKFKFSNLNRDVPIGSPPPPSNLAYYLNMASKNDTKNSHSAPESPRSSPEKHCETANTSTSCSRNTGDRSSKSGNSQHIFQEMTSSKTTLEQVQTIKTNKKLNFPV